MSKSAKYLVWWVVLNEKQASTFVHFLYFSTPIDPLNQLCIVVSGQRAYIYQIRMALKLLLSRLQLI